MAVQNSGQTGGGERGGSPVALAREPPPENGEEERNQQQRGKGFAAYGLLVLGHRLRHHRDGFGFLHQRDTLQARAFLAGPVLYGVTVCGGVACQSIYRTEAGLLGQPHRGAHADHYSYHDRRETREQPVVFEPPGRPVVNPRDQVFAFLSASRLPALRRLYPYAHLEAPRAPIERKLGATWRFF